MNLKNIQQIVNSEHPMWEALLIQELAKDENVIPEILDILNEERRRKKEVMAEMNMLLSQADTIIDEPKLNKEKFFSKKVEKFYEDKKNEPGVFHCFKR